VSRRIAIGVFTLGLIKIFALFYLGSVQRRAQITYSVVVICEPSFYYLNAWEFLGQLRRTELLPLCIGTGRFSNSNPPGAQIRQRKYVNNIADSKTGHFHKRRDCLF